MTGAGEPGEQVLTDLFRSMHAGVYATDTAGRITIINPTALRLLGRDGEDLVGTVVHDLVHYADGRGQPRRADTCALLSVIRTGVAARSDDDTFWRSDGTDLPVSWVSAPVVQDGRVTGAVVVFHDATVRHVEAERRAAQQEASDAVQERLAEQNERLAVLGRLSEALSTLDLDKALRRLARLSVGRLVDGCVIDTVEAGRVRRVALAPDDGSDASAGPARPVPPLTSAARGPLARALLTGVQQTVAAGAVPPGTGPDGQDPFDVEQERLFDELSCAHALVTPIIVRRQVLGAMTWLRTDVGRPFTESDAFLAAEIARRAALALDNARLFGEQRRAAETLQRSLLTVLPEPDHLHIAARYLPATAGAEVGGDWYDAFVLSDGATSIVIGDILGHDLAAAAKMGQVRNMLRGISADRLAPPSNILARLDTAIVALGVDALATCMLGRIEQPEELRAAGRRLLRWSVAGHLPPALVSADGEVRLLDEAGDLMLGVEPELPRADHAVVVEPGDTIWLYTDGLVERSDQPLDAGLTRLRQALAAVAGLPLEQALDRLLERMLPDDHPDDVALLVVRAHPEDRPRPDEAARSRPQRRA